MNRARLPRSPPSSAPKTQQARRDPEQHQSPLAGPASASPCCTDASDGGASFPRPAHPTDLARTTLAPSLSPLSLSQARARRFTAPSRRAGCLLASWPTSNGDRARRQKQTKKQFLLVRRHRTAPYQRASARPVRRGARVVKAERGLAAGRRQPGSRVETKAPCSFRSLL